MHLTWRAGSPDSQFSRWLMMRVDGDGGLAGLPVADDQLALATADRGDRVDRLDAGLQRLVHLAALDHRGGLRLQRAQFGLLDRRPWPSSGTPSGSTTRPRNPSPTGTDRISPVRRDLLAFVDLGEVAEDDHADFTLVQVEREPADTARELQQLVIHGRGKALDPRDAVAGLGNDAYLFPGRRVGLVRLDEARQRVPDLIGPDCQLRHGPRVFLVSWLTALSLSRPSLSRLSLSRYALCSPCSPIRRPAACAAPRGGSPHCRR